MTSLENLKAQVRFLHEIEAKETIEEAKSKAENIIREAKEKAERTRTQKMEEKSKDIEKKGQEDLARTKADARNKILSLRFQLLEETMAEFSEYLRKTVENEGRYHPSLNSLIVEAATKLSGNEFEIVTNSRDKEFVSENLEQLKNRISSMKGQQTKVRIGKETLDALGGTVVRTMDKKQIFNNTLEARTDKFQKESGQKIYEMLFEGVEE